MFLTAFDNRYRIGCFRQFAVTDFDLLTCCGRSSQSLKG